MTTAVGTRRGRIGGLAPAPAVEVLRWPRDAGRRRALREEGRGRLWLLEPGELAPELEPLEDWARLPLDEVDLEARVERLAARADSGVGLEPGEVRVGRDGLLDHRGARVVVPAVEAALLDLLGAHPGRVLLRDELLDAGWPDGHPSDRALDSRIHTLRVRLEPVGLVIHTIRGHGFLLAAAPDPARRFAPRAAARRSPWSNS